MVPIGILLLALVNINSRKVQEDVPRDDTRDVFPGKYTVYSLPVPEELDFAGENVPLEYFDVREALDRELLVNTYWQSQTLLFIKKANRYFPLIEEVLARNSVPEDFKYLAVAESGLSQAVSPAGAVGFWQFLAGTARDYGLEVGKQVDERYNIELATEAACRYFKESYKKYGDWTMVAASYNRGRRGISEQIDRQGEEDYYDLLCGEETGRYVYRLLAFKIILSDPSGWGFSLRDSDLYPPLKADVVKVDTSIVSMKDFAAGFGLNYKMLKYYNPWLRDSSLENSRGRTYKILIPPAGFRTDVYRSDSITK